MQVIIRDKENKALDRAVEKGVEPNAITPRSDRPRKGWGSMLSSIQTTPGLCGKPRAGKGACWRKVHEGDCP